MSKIGKAKRLLYTERLNRVPPMTDDKVITSWNALVMRAFAEAGAAFGRDDWIDIAVKNAEFVFDRLVREDGRLMRSCKADADSVATIPGFLEDYAYLADALTHLYEATFDLRWLERAEEMCDAMIELFLASCRFSVLRHRIRSGGVDRPASRHVRQRTTERRIGGVHGAAPLCGVYRKRGFGEGRAANLRTVRELMERAPSAFSWWLQAAEFYANPVKQVVIVGENG